MQTRGGLSSAGAVLTAVAVLVCGPTPAAAQTAKARYEAALAREPLVRQLIESTAPDAAAPDRRRAIDEAVRLIAAYELVPRRHPTSGYSDNALYQAAGLAETLYRRYGRAADRATARRLYEWLVREYPSSSLVRRARASMAGLEQTARAPAVRPVPAPFPAPARRPPPRPQEEAAASPPAAQDPGPSPEAGGTRDRGSDQAASAPAPAPFRAGERPTASAPAAGTGEIPSDLVGTAAAPPAGDAASSAPLPQAPAALEPPAVLTGVERTILPEAVRVTLTLDREVSYREDRLANPARVFFDLRGVVPAPHLRDVTLRYPADVVRQVRTGLHDEFTRIVFDAEGVDRYRVFTLDSPFRVVFEAERRAAPAGATGEAPPGAAVPDADGKFSIARQLGLGVSRIVIDPGHGGHDPGARAHGLSEADLVLDVALRLEQLLAREPGLEVVLTRRDDTYVPLEERTAIANRAEADLFLSIHANAARNPQARGIETYYLSFASNPEAEAVAARENATSGGLMHHLPDIVRAIAFNSKLDESRDLAAIVQESLVTRLRRVNRDVRNLGVKKAPFVVLVGAQMPSVLAEISFLTNRQEAALLKTPAYRQHIAEALFQAIVRYRQSLKTALRTAAH